MQLTKASQAMHQPGFSRIFVRLPPLVELHLDVYANGYQNCICVKLALLAVQCLHFSIHFSSRIWV